MKCVHYWVTDSKGFARCQRCPATKQFPGYTYPKMRPSTLSQITARGFYIHPDLCAKSYVRVT